jgi:hypothetical protein
MKELGLECTTYVTNRHRPDRPIKLFSIEEVTSLEKTEPFQKAIELNEEKRKERRAKSEKSKEIKVARLQKQWKKLRDKLSTEGHIFFVGGTE